MTKITSKILTLLLAFSMVFTTFGFVGIYEVNAASGANLLKVKIVDGDGNPVKGVELQLVYATDEEDINELGETDVNGIAELDLSDTNLFFYPVEGPNNPNVGIVPDALYYIRPVSTEYEYDDVTVSFGLENDFETFYIVKVNGSDYSGSTIEMTMTTQGSNPNPVDYVDMQANNKPAWDALTAGVALEDVNEGDLILDVRDEAPWASGRLPNSIHVNITTSANIDGKYVKDNTPLSRALDAAYEAKEGGKIVVVCNSGQSLAARALQYYNTKYYDNKGVDDDEVTYLKGGAKTGFGNATLETTVNYVDVQKNAAAQWAKHGAKYSNITSDDFILDVRDDEAWQSGFLPGSVHVSVNTTDTNLVKDGKVVNGSALAKALDSAFAASEGKRIVLVCNSGKVLAARAMEYYNSKNYGGKGVDLSRVTFLIGGASNPSTSEIPATDKVNSLDYIEMQKNNKAAWNANGIPYADINDKDFILDVRADDVYAEGHLKGSTHVKVTEPASDLDKGYVKADSNMAKALDAAYAASGDKRIVVICNTGNSLAARALQYYNTKNYKGFGVDYSKLTFLIGGKTAIPASALISTADEEAAAADAKARKVTTVTVNVKTVNAKAIDAAVKKAGGNEKYVTKIVLGKKVKKISKNSFKKYKKTTTLEIKTKKLKKSSVKGSLKGSKIKTVQVKVGKKKVNKKYVKKYKKIFTKKNAGKKVKVK